jgi:hypothetical protein
VPSDDVSNSPVVPSRSAARRRCPLVLEQTCNGPRRDPPASVQRDDALLDVRLRLHWAPQSHPASARSGEGLYGPVADQPSFELREHRNDCLHRLAVRRGRVRGIERKELPSDAEPSA